MLNWASLKCITNSFSDNWNMYSCLFALEYPKILRSFQFSTEIVYEKLISKMQMSINIGAGTRYSYKIE